MWERLGQLKVKWGQPPLRQAQGRLPAVRSSEARQPQGGPSGLWEGHDFSRAAKGGTLAALAAEGRERLRIAAIGPATKKAIEQRGIKVDVVPKEYVAESVVRSLRQRVKGKRVLLIRAKVARDVIPRELRKAGAHVDVVEAYETVVPLSSRTGLRAALKNARRPDVITFTSSSTVRNFVALLGSRTAFQAPHD